MEKTPEELAANLTSLSAMLDPSSVKEEEDVNSSDEASNVSAEAEEGAETEGSEETEGDEGAEAEGEASTEKTAAPSIEDLMQRIEGLTNKVQSLESSVPAKPARTVPEFKLDPIEAVKDDNELADITSSAEAFNTTINRAIKEGTNKAVEHIWKELPSIVMETSARVAENIVLVRDFYRENPDLQKLGADYRQKVATVYTALEKKNPGVPAESILAMLGKEVRMKYKMKPTVQPVRQGRTGGFGVHDAAGGARTTPAKPTGLAAELKAMTA